MLLDLGVGAADERHVPIDRDLFGVHAVANDDGVTRAAV
jgi:hypothetical protein